jgi:hypothetical protein
MPTDTEQILADKLGRDYNVSEKRTAFTFLIR